MFYCILQIAQKILIILIYLILFESILRVSESTAAFIMTLGLYQGSYYRQVIGKTRILGPFHLVLQLILTSFSLCSILMI